MTKSWSMERSSRTRRASPTRSSSWGVGGDGEAVGEFGARRRGLAPLDAGELKAQPASGLTTSPAADIVGPERRPIRPAPTMRLVAKAALIAVCGAAGALARYGIGVAIGARAFPWATLAINLTGSLVLGVVVKLGLDRGWSEAVVAPVAIGFLGAYTTFSTFSYETFTLTRMDRPAAAVLYVAVSVIGGVAAAGAGWALASAISR